LKGIVSIEPNNFHIVDAEFQIPCVGTIGIDFMKKYKEERYSRVPGLSAKGTKGKWRYASSKARLKCATYPRSQCMDM